MTHDRHAPVRIESRFRAGPPHGIDKELRRPRRSAVRGPQMQAELRWGPVSDRVRLQGNVQVGEEVPFEGQVVQAGRKGGHETDGERLRLGLLLQAAAERVSDSGRT